MSSSAPVQPGTPQAPMQQGPPVFPPPPPPAPPVVPPPKQRRLKPRHWALIAVAALLVLGLVVGLAAALSPTKPNSTTTPQTTAGHHKVGEQVSVGATWVVTVNSATLNAGIGTLAPQAGNTFLVVDVTLKNVSAQQQAVSSLLQFSLKDATGLQYTLSGAGLMASGATTPDGTVEAGGLLRGQITFEVPTSQHAFTFRFQPGLTSAQTIWDITNPQAAAPIPTAQAPTAAPQTTVHHKVGEQASVGANWVVTVTKVSTTKGGEYDQAKAGYQYVVLDVTLKNISSQEQDALMLYTMRDATGLQYTETFILDAAPSPSGKVEAGGQIRGQLVYEVPQSMHQFTWAAISDYDANQVIWDISV